MCSFDMLLDAIFLVIGLTVFILFNFYKLWLINSSETQKKLPAASYQNSLSYHSSAVNVLRFSPSGK